VITRVLLKALLVVLGGVREPVGFKL